MLNGALAAVTDVGDGVGNGVGRDVLVRPVVAGVDNTRVVETVVVVVATGAVILAVVVVVVGGTHGAMPVAHAQTAGTIEQSKQLLSTPLYPRWRSHIANVLLFGNGGTDPNNRLLYSNID